MNSVHITSSTGGIGTDNLFSTGPAANCHWKMQLGQSMHVKAVLLIGNYYTQANTRNWILTVGNNSDPILNQQIHESSVWAREIKVGAWGSVIAIIKTTSEAPLELAYVGVFASLHDCSTTNTITVASLPETIFTCSTQTYTLVNSLDASCIDVV